MPNPFGNFNEPVENDLSEEFIQGMREKSKPEPQVKKESGEFTPVSQADLEQLLRELDVPMDLKVKVVDIIQINNREKVKSYTIDFIPGQRIKIENGRIVK